MIKSETSKTCVRYARYQLLGNNSYPPDKAYLVNQVYTNKKDHNASHKTESQWQEPLTMLITNLMVRKEIVVIKGLHREKNRN